MEIKFRGLRTDGKGWVYGLPYSSMYDEYIDQIVEGDCHHDVDPSSVGQFTGLKDKNGKEIYEGDKLEPDTDLDELMSVVRWDEYSAKYVVDSYGYNSHLGEGGQDVYSNELSIFDTSELADTLYEFLEIIGNIHENE